MHPLTYSLHSLAKVPYFSIDQDFTKGSEFPISMMICLFHSHCQCLNGKVKVKIPQAEHKSRLISRWSESPLVDIIVIHPRHKLPSFAVCGPVLMGMGKHMASIY